MASVPPGYPPPGFYAKDFQKLRPPKPGFDYSRLVKEGLSLVWRHKFLWFYGLFAVGSTFSFNWNVSGNFTSGDNSSRRAPSQFSRNLSDFIHQHIMLIIAGAAVLFILAILFWLWSIICRGAIIHSVKDIREGTPASFGAAFKRGAHSFVDLLLFDLFLALIALGVGVIIAAAVFLIILLGLAMAAAGKIVLIALAALLLMAILLLLAVSLGYFFFFLFLFVLWIVPLTLLITYATRAVVLERAGPIQALRRAGRLMLDTTSRTLLLFLLSVGLSIAGNIIVFTASMLAAVPAIIAWIFTYGAHWPVGGIIIAAILSLAPAAVLIISYAALNTFFATFWTDAYLRLTGREPAQSAPTATAAF